MYTLSSSSLGLAALSPLHLTFSLAPLHVTVSVMTGTPQEISSQIIDHERSLIGVLALTTMDGFRPSVPDEIKHFVLSVGLTLDQGEAIAKKPASACMGGK